MSQCDYAWWKPITANFNQGMMLSPMRGLVIHITDGTGNAESVRQDFNRPAKGASAHFCVDKNGDLFQFVDTDNRAWAVDGDKVDAHWLSVENVAKNGERLTDSQITTCGMLYRWIHEEFDVPFQRATRANPLGLAYHHMFGIGDHACPGMPVRLQLERIVREAWYLWWRDTGDEDAPPYIQSWRP